MLPKPLSLIAVTTAVLMASQTAQAYSKPGHFAITNAAYQVMRAASATNAQGVELALKSPGTCANGQGECGQSVTQQQWNVFLEDIDWTRRLLGAQESGIEGTFHAWRDDGNDVCRNAPEPTTLADFWVEKQNGANVFTPASMSADHRDLNENKCRADWWTPVGMYADIAGRVPADGRGQQGKVLGWHAKNRDDDLQETMIDTNPLIGAPLGQALAIGSEAYERLLGALLVPLVCAWQLIKGDASKCRADARRIADKTNLVEVFTALIPGFHLDRSELYIGFWHLINVRNDSSLSHAFDDDQGMYLPEAGPARIPGSMDAAIMTGTQLMYVRLVPDKSKGVERYQVKTSADGNQRSEDRSDLDWRREPIGTTEFSPLDNLAYAGYEKIHPNHPIKKLSWPLHAIGDATVPMHVVATTSWGHGPYEQWVENHWQELVFDKCPRGDATCNDSTLRARQSAQAQRVLQIAYKWREYLGHAPSFSQHGIRDLITDLAKDTLARVGDSPTNWPWCDLCSVAFDADGGKPIVETIAQAFPSALVPGGASSQETLQDPVGYYDSYANQIRGLVESAMGAKIAFLIWHAEHMPAQCIEDLRYGCRDDGDCCTGVACVNNTCGSIVIP